MRAMKDSGVEWIGKIPETWNLVRLRYLCNIRTGNQDTQDRLDEGNYPFYVRSPHVERSNKYTFEGDDILMAGDGVGAGRIFHLTNGKYACHQRVYSLHNIRSIDRFYLFLYLQTLFYLSIETANSKSTVDSVRLPMLLDFYVAHPSNKEQKGIAAILEAKCAEIDKVVEQTRATIEEYKNLKQAIITEAVTKGVRGPRPMKPSGVEWIGDIPEDWLSHKLKYVSSIKSGDYVDAQELSSDGMYPVYGGGEQISSYHSYNVNEETIIIGRVGARCGCVTLTKQKCWATDNALILSTNMYTRFAYYLLTGANLNTLNTSNAQPLITGTKIMNLIISNPCKDEQQEIAAYLDTKCAEIDRIIEKKEQLIEELGNYKKSLIYECVTGKREIKIHNYSQNAIC